MNEPIDDTDTWGIVSTWIEIGEFVVFLGCASSCYHNLNSFNESSKDGKSNIKDYRCRFFKALFMASLARGITLLIILIIGQEKEVFDFSFFLKEVGFTFPSLIWAYCYSIIVDFFVTLYQKLLEKNINIVSQLYYFVYWVVCFIYGLMIIEALMKKKYLFFVHNSRIVMALLYFITAIGLIYFGLNLIYEIYKDSEDENQTKIMMEKILVFISLCVGIFLTRVVLDCLIAFNAIDIDSTKNLVETIIVLTSELLPLVISLTLLKDKKKKTNSNDTNNWDKTLQVETEMKSRLI